MLSLIGIIIAHSSSIEEPNDMQRFRHQLTAVLTSFLYENEHKIRYILRQT